MAKKGNNTTALAMNIQDRELGPILSEKYLSYALSTIVSRSLPDVRDGLKPVHRRVLYAMIAIVAASPKRRPRNARAVVGDVIGKYPPSRRSPVHL